MCVKMGLVSTYSGFLMTSTNLLIARKDENYCITIYVHLAFFFFLGTKV